MGDIRMDWLDEIEARAEAVAKDLRDLLPEQVDYASLVCAEGFAHGYHYVWTEPEPYAMEAGAKVIDDLLAEVRRLRAELAEAHRYIYGDSDATESGGANETD